MPRHGERSILLLAILVVLVWLGLLSAQRGALVMGDAAGPSPAQPDAGRAIREREPEQVARRRGKTAAPAPGATPGPFRSPGIAPHGGLSVSTNWERYGCHLNPGNPSCRLAGNAAGEPVINCFFVFDNLACGGQTLAVSDGATCNEMVRISRGLPPLAADACGGVPPLPQPAPDCPPGSRDPTCDGFGP